MVRLFSTYFPKRMVVLAASETLLVFVALPGVLVFYHGADFVSPFTYAREFVQVIVIGVICITCLYFQDLYSAKLSDEPSQLLVRLARALGVACMLLAALYVLFPVTELKGGLAVVAIMLIGACLTMSHNAFVRLNRAGWWSTSTLVIGDGPLARHVIEAIQQRPALGLRLAGYIGNSASSSPADSDVPYLGHVEDLPTVVQQRSVQRVIVAMDDRRTKLPVEALLDLKTAGVAVQEGAEFYEFAMGRIPIDNVRLSWLVFGPGFRVSKLRSFHKRLLSVILSSIGLVVLAPLMLVIAALIRIDSPGPAIFRQVRVGMGGLPFTLYKFRTMYHQADRGKDPLPVQPNDSRVTRVGLWLRRFRFDEIPQLYNILLGHMSLVGPRPFVPNQELELVQQIPLYKQRWAIKPGATGWAQVQRGYCTTVDDNVEKLAYDLFYIKNMSVGFDLLILFKTIKIVLAGLGGR
jgi:exopolysaccharide biosynthesis polyprenyl glycosylphosphotransferase